MAPVPFFFLTIVGIAFSCVMCDGFRCSNLTHVMYIGIYIGGVYWVLFNLELCFGSLGHWFSHFKLVVGREDTGTKLTRG